MQSSPDYFLGQGHEREWGHVFLYDPNTLRKTLEVAGFKQIKEYRIGDMAEPMFREAESRTRDKRRPFVKKVNVWEAMAFEAVR